MPFFAYDDVVVNGNSQPFAGIHNLPRDFYVLAARRGIA